MNDACLVFTYITIFSVKFGFFSLFFSSYFRTTSSQNGCLLMDSFFRHDCDVNHHYRRCRFFFCLYFNICGFTPTQGI